MNTDQKIIKNKVGLLNLADTLGSFDRRLPFACAHPSWLDTEPVGNFLYRQ